jgi:hypothetical protein
MVRVRRPRCHPHPPRHSSGWWSTSDAASSPTASSLCVTRVRRCRATSVARRAGGARVLAARRALPEHACSPRASRAQLRAHLRVRTGRPRRARCGARMSLPSARSRRPDVCLGRSVARIDPVVRAISARTYSMVRTVNQDSADVPRARRPSVNSHFDTRRGARRRSTRAPRGALSLTIDVYKL